MPQTYTKVSGTWRNCNNMFVKVAGTWQRVKTVWARTNGNWGRAGGTVQFTIAANVTNWNLHSALSAGGYPPNAAPWQVEITINSGVLVHSYDATKPAMQLDALPSGASVKIFNNGRILGSGGRGGFASINPPGAAAGERGGTAILTNTPIQLTNLGEISAGGGGGGAGGLGMTRRYIDQGNGDGYACNENYVAGMDGARGQGAFNAAGESTYNPSGVGGTGGAGGVFGAAGGAGGDGKGLDCNDLVRTDVKGGAGGPPGYWIQGIAYLTVVTNTGTTKGPAA